MIAFTALVRKDLVLFFRDRRSLIMNFAAPIMLASFFAMIFGGSGRGNNVKVKIGLVDEDGGAVSQSIGKKLAAEEMLSVVPLSRAEAQTQVREGKLSVAAVLPKGFGDQASDAFFRRDLPKPKLEILYDPSEGTERQLVEGVLMGRITEAVSAHVFSGKQGNVTVQKALDDLANAPATAMNGDIKRVLESVRQLNTTRESTGGGAPAAGPALTVPFTTEAKAVAAAEGDNLSGHYFAGMGVQFILFMGIEAGVGMLLQRKRGLWRRFRAAPVGRATLLGSRVLSSALCALTTLTVLFLFARFVFGVPMVGSLAGFALIALAFATLTAGYGLCIAALGNSPEATRPIAILATLLMVMLGGSWIPTFMFPSWLQSATLVMPTRWAVDGLDAMSWRGLGFSAALLPAAVLFGYALLFGLIALKYFKWDAE
jgi:ABC-2 type transport system permease protein